MKGIIEKIWRNESRKGQPYLTLEIDGERYNFWDKKLFDGLEEGYAVEYDFKRSGKYRNITGIDVLDGHDVSESAPYGGHHANHRH